MSSFEGSPSQSVDEVNEEKFETINFPHGATTTSVSASDLSQSVSTANEKPPKHRIKFDVSSEQLVKIFKGVDGNEEPNGGSDSSYGQKILSALASSQGDVVTSDVDYISPEGSQKYTFDSLTTIDKLTSNRTQKRRPSITARVCTHEGCETYHFCVGDLCYKHTKEGDDEDRVEIASSADTPATATTADQQPVDKLKELRQTLEEDMFFAGPYLDIEGKRVRTAMVHSLKARILRERVLARRDEYDPAKAACVLSEATEALTKDINAGLVGTSTMSSCELGQLYLQFQRLDIDSDGVITVADLRVLIGRVDPQFSRVMKPDHITEKCVQMIADTVPHKLDCAGITFVDYILGLQKLRQRETDSNVPSKLLIQSAFWDLRKCILHTLDDDDRGKLSGWLLKRGYALVPEKLNAWKRRYFTTRRCPRNGLILEYFESWDESAVYSDMSRFGGGGGGGRLTLVDTAARTEDVANGDNFIAIAANNNGCEDVDINTGAHSDANNPPTTVSDRESMTAEPASSLSVVHSGLNDSAAVDVVAVDSWTDAERLAADTVQGNNKHKKGSKGEVVADRRGPTAEKITVYQTLQEAATAQMQPSDALSGDGNNNDGCTSTGPQMRVYGNQNTIIPRPLHQGFISLTDIALVDFAPQTQVVGNADLTKHNIDCAKQIAFQITVYNGPRYTLSGDQEAVIMWVSQLSWYVAASRLMREWRVDWGTQRMATMTLRDWINAAAVIVKLDRTTKPVDDHRPPEDVRTLGDCVLDFREREMLYVVKLKDGDSVEHAGERVLAAIQSHHGNPLVLNHTNKSSSVFLWKYARALKNRYNMKKFHVICDSKATATHCAVCHARFKYLTMRVEYRKYHCRCCGRVVCHACCGSKAFLKHTQTVERVCTDCIRNGGPPRHRLRKGSSNSSSKPKATLPVDSPAATSVADSGGDNNTDATKNNNNNNGNNNAAEVDNKAEENEEEEENEEAVRARVAEEAERQRVLAEEQRAIRAQEKAAAKAKAREMRERAAALEAKREEARAALRARQEARLGRREEVQDKAAEAKAAREKAAAPPIEYNYS